MDILKPLPEYSGVDARMILFIEYSYGDIDTVKIGSPKLIDYKGSVYDKDSILIKLLE
ncbi:MAG: hypothetical protein WBA74_23915 [Cyclobacteriaceae bacterium]